jgi:hypothetical protein
MSALTAVGLKGEGKVAGTDCIRARQSRREPAYDSGRTGREDAFLAGWASGRLEGKREDRDGYAR